MRVIPRRLMERPRVHVLERRVDDGAWSVRLRVDGMACDACAGRVRDALAAVPGVERATVSLGSGEATVETGRDIGEEELAEAVRRTVVLSWARDVLARLGGSGG